MKYIKYNCASMSMISTELHEIISEFNNAYYNYSDIIRANNSFFENMDNLYKLMLESERMLEDININLQNIVKSFDSIVDVYYLTDRLILESVINYLSTEIDVLQKNSEMSINNWFDDF